jgi:eukaryotic-like serine/threonine-protein kinase
MEYLDGTLGVLVRRARDEAGTPGLAPMDTVILGIMLADAVAAVHRRARSVHFDIKPENVLIASVAHRAGRVRRTAHVAKLADFGLSKRLPSCVQSSLATAAAPSIVPGAGGGTAGYAPREQLNNRGQRSSDVYAVGATLLFAASGKHPFDAENPGGLSAHQKISLTSQGSHSRPWDMAFNQA